MTMPAWISELQAFSTPIIAIGAVVIASQQYRLSKQKLRLDLYDRRYQIYTVIQENISITLNQKFDRNGDENTWKMNIKVRESRFLFDTITFDYINQIETDVLIYRYGVLANEEAEKLSSPRYLDDINAHNQTGKRLLESMRSLDNLFRAYLSIDDKLSFSSRETLEIKNLQKNLQ